MSEETPRGFELSWPAEMRAAVSDAVKGRTVESLEIGEGTGGYQFVLITFEDGMQLRIECEHLEAVEPIQPQHI